MKRSRRVQKMKRERSDVELLRSIETFLSVIASELLIVITLIFFLIITIQ